MHTARKKRLQHEQNIADAIHDLNLLARTASEPHFYDIPRPLLPPFPFTEVFYVPMFSTRLSRTYTNLSGALTTRMHLPQGDKSRERTEELITPMKVAGQSCAVSWPN